MIKTAILMSMLLMASTAHATTDFVHHLAGQKAGRSGWQPDLMLREQRPANGDVSHPVLYIHGATFPSALSVFFRFDGASWADSLNAAGFDAFGLDFAGYGGSERYPSMATINPGTGAAEGRSEIAARQIERAVRFILARTKAKRVSIVAHSWGTIAAGRFAAEHPDMVDKVVLFGAIAQRSGTPPSVTQPWDMVTIAAQHARFVKDVPAGHVPVLVEHDFSRWAQTYLASDPTSATRTPPSVAAPAGPSADVAAAWSGAFPYDMAGIRAPILLIRGAWDSSCTDADIAWFREHLTHASHVEDVKVPEATHLMHLETGRAALYAATNAFLRAPND